MALLNGLIGGEFKGGRVVELAGLSGTGKTALT
jgi:hypothetical protein